MPAPRASRVLTELLPGLVGLEPVPAQFGGIGGFIMIVCGEDGRHGALEPGRRGQIGQPGIDRRQYPVFGQGE